MIMMRTRTLWSLLCLPAVLLVTGQCLAAANTGSNGIIDTTSEGSSSKFAHGGSLAFTLH